MGGLGIRTANHQNKIQFLKRIGHLNEKPNTLWSKIIRNKYGTNFTN